MRGFKWTEEPGQPDVPVAPGGDLWCVRDAFCQLMGWPLHSEDWQAFIPGPQGGDTYRLAQHLGLEYFDPQQHLAEIIARQDHPGVMLYALQIPRPTGPQPMGHTIYAPHLRNWPGIPWEYAAYSPELFSVFIDTRQRPYTLS